MTRLMVFTENYNVPAGGASYIVDLCNGLAGSYDDVVFASNPNGYAPDTSGRVRVPHRMQSLGILTADRIGVDVTSASWLPRRHEIAHSLRRHAIARDPLVFSYNIAVCRLALKKVRPSAVLAFNGGYPAGRSVLSMVVAAHREQVPVALCVVSIPGVRPEGALGNWEARMDGMIGDCADVIVVNAGAIAVALTEVRGLPKSKIRVVHNSLPDLDLQTQDDKGRGLRIGCVSRMDRNKGTRFLVEAFARIAKRDPGVQLVLVGDGPERQNVQRLIEDLGIQDRVSMTGQYVGDVNELVATFDIYAFPSLWEGLPYAILEAMRLGRAIVATDVGGVSEAIVDGETGLLVPPAEVDAMECAIERLMHAPELRARLGMCARRRFVEDFSLDAMYSRITSVFSEAGMLVPK